MFLINLKMKYVLLISCSLFIAQFDRCKTSLDTSSERADSSEQYTAHSKKSEPGPKENFEKYCTSCHGNEVNAFVDRKWKYGNKKTCLLYTSPSPRDRQKSRMPSSA